MKADDEKLKAKKSDEREKKLNEKSIRSKENMILWKLERKEEAKQRQVNSFVDFCLKKAFYRTK
jgi:hypothetical protein